MCISYLSKQQHSAGAEVIPADDKGGMEEKRVKEDIQNYENTLLCLCHVYNCSNQLKNSGDAVNGRNGGPRDHMWSHALEGRMCWYNESNRDGK